MPRNVEIKAGVTDMKRLHERVFELTDSLGTQSRQQDTFFGVPEGRLKLRVADANPNGELIFYNRPNTIGPKACDYSRVSVNDAEALKSTLSAALGIMGTVNKRRHIYLLDQTRIHLDDVDQLGTFMELEVVLTDEQTNEDGEKVALDLMTKLGIDSKDLIACAYVDLVLEKEKGST